MAIDPGWGGGIASYNTRDRDVEVHKSPDTIIGIVDLIRTFRPNANIVETFAIIEKVHSMPGDGVRSVWRFAENTTAWKTALFSAGIPFKEVPPKTWMKQIGGLPKDKKKRKNQLKLYAQQLYPNIKVTLWNADALCMLSTMYEQTAPVRFKDDELIKRLLS